MNMSLAILAMCVLLGGCAPSFVITNEVMDEVEGTCTFDVQFPDAPALGSNHAGKRTIVVRPYETRRLACRYYPTGVMEGHCDPFRQECTLRLGARAPVYESAAPTE